MTVVELIEKLKTFSPDTLVVTEGYEDGYEPVKNVQTIKVVEQPDRKWWNGKYDISDAPDALEVVFLNAESKSENK